MTKAKIVDYEYDTPEAYQYHLRTGGAPHDRVVIGGILFTQDEYDMDGRVISYGNKKHGKAMSIFTRDRYGETGFDDAVVELDELIVWRNDIVYAE